MKCTPILVSVYDRREHLKKCVESLRLNPLSDQSDLFIVSDAASVLSDEAKVNQVRSSIKEIRGFRHVYPIERDRNMGSFLSVKNAIEDLVREFGRIIFLEDDNIVSSNFLEYLNDGLKFYQEDTSIFSVSGYNYPIQIPPDYPHSVYKWQGFSAWGVGLWRDRWESIKWGYSEFDRIKNNRRKRNELDLVAGHLFFHFSNDIRLGRTIIDTNICYHMFMSGLFSIFPVLSKIRNIGDDGTGEHGGFARRYARQALDCKSECRFVRGIQPDEKIDGALRKHFKVSMKERIVFKLTRLIPKKYKRRMMRKCYSWKRAR